MKGNDIHKERDGCLELLITLEHIIFNLNEENLDYSIQQTMELFDSNFSHSFNVVITYLVFYAYCSLKNEIDIYLKYLDLIQMKEEEINENITKIRDLFMKNVSEAGTQASYFLIQNFIDRNLRDKDITKNIASNYFAHYKTEIKNFFIQIEDFFHKNLEELKKNDWELHKKLIREGVNPNEIAKIIRNDEIEKLQEISSQNDFNFNQEIEPSLYERCDFINRFNIPLIHYAAFFGSIKCFKFLLLHNSKFKNVGKYAAAGGNIEIVHLCEQNNFTFKGACEAAIELHQNDIFRYIFDNKIQTFHNLFVLGEKCILYHNYEILSFLEEKGLEIESIMIINSAKDGNLYLLKHFFQNVPVSDYILGDVFGSRNIELIKYFISQKWININFKDEFKKTALIYSCVLGYTDIVKSILKRKEINIHIKDELDKTALMYACENGYIEIVKLLLNKMRIVKPNEEYENAFSLAAQFGHMDIINLLLLKGNKTYSKAHMGELAILSAAENGHIDIIKLFLKEEGININVRDKYGETPLIKAAANNQIEVVKLLLEQKGIDLNVKRICLYLKVFLFQNNIWCIIKLFETALMVAFKYRYFEIVKLILEKEGIDISTLNNGKTS